MLPMILFKTTILHSDTLLSIQMCRNHSNISHSTPTPGKCQYFPLLQLAYSYFFHKKRAVGDCSRKIRSWEETAFSPRTVPAILAFPVFPVEFRPAFADFYLLPHPLQEGGAEEEEEIGQRRQNRRTIRPAAQKEGQ